MTACGGFGAQHTPLSTCVGLASSDFSSHKHEKQNTLPGCVVNQAQSDEFSDAAHPRLGLPCKPIATMHTHMSMSLQVLTRDVPSGTGVNITAGSPILVNICGQWLAATGPPATLLEHQHCRPTVPLTPFTVFERRPMSESLGARSV